MGRPQLEGALPTIKQRVRKVALLEQLGPGLVTGAADDDPSGIATYSQAGAQLGFGLLWTLLLTYPLMTAIQLASARIGRVTGAGLAKNLSAVLPGWAVTTLVALLFMANTINIGADLASMGEAAHLAAGFDRHVFTLLFALVSLGLQLFISYGAYAKVLKWLTLTLLAYVAVLFAVRIDWGAAARGLIPGPASFTKDAVVTIVAVFGTTISPYLFFWQSAQEVEEIEEDPKAEPLKEAPRQGRRELARIRIDTFSGMAISNLIAMAIMISTAATLHASGHTQIDTAAAAAEALRPVAGPFAFVLFSLGIVGTGLLAVPVLAGSAAYAIGESQGWECGLEYKPWEAVGFYTVIGIATLLGLLIDWSPIDPMRALFWSAVVNGIVAVPIMVAMMLVASRRSQMGRFTAGLGLRVFGWAATVVMGASVVAMLVTLAF
ncbi:MAG: divalent metal cation transporter [Caulobacterales bacterium]|nr:divalent metal cation transporter [Caulobacterales bacterium]